MINQSDRVMNNDKGFIWTFVILGGAIATLISLLSKDEPLITSDGKKILEDKNDKKQLFDAIKSRKETVKINGETIRLR